jgi:uncharacterized delta-60 repeat protein
MGMRRVTMIVLSTVAVVMIAATGTAAAALQLDPSFGAGGLALVPGQRGPGHPVREALAIEPDGALILASDGTLQRLDPSGHLDPTFGAEGAVTPPAVAGGTFEIAGAAVDPQGRLVVVGTSTPPQPEPKIVSNPKIYFLYEGRHRDARVMRYLPDGRLDPTFGQGGIVETDFGLPTPEYEGTKLSAGPIVETTGVAVDAAGRIIVTGGAAAGTVNGGCFHDDATTTLTDAAFVARLSESGAVDTSFGEAGVFGGRSASQNPLKAEEAGSPVVTPSDGVIFQRGGWGYCARAAGALGYVGLTSAGAVASAGAPDALGGRVSDATVAPDGSAVLLLEPLKTNREGPYAVEKLRADGRPDRSFGKAGKVTLRLPGESFATGVAVAADGEILVDAVKVPPQSKHEERWRQREERFSVMLIGLTPNGARDPRIGPGGVLTEHVPHRYGNGRLWLDGEDRPTVTLGYRPKAGPVGLAALRFEPLP